MVLAQVGNLKLIELLLTRNVIVETRNESGETPFVAATANGFVDIMKLLLRCNAEADTSDNKGQRALHKVIPPPPPHGPTSPNGGPIRP